MQNIDSENKIYEFYQNKFIYVYADLVAITGQKPQEILFEIEACFAHIAKAKTTLQNDVQLDNYKKAYGHLVRAALDAAKLLWLTKREEVERLYKNQEALDFGSSSSAATLSGLYHESQQAAICARKNEVAQTGAAPEGSLPFWEKAIERQEEFLAAFDNEKIDKIGRAKFKKYWKEFIMTLVLGVLAGLVANNIPTAWGWLVDFF